MTETLTADPDHVTRVVAIKHRLSAQTAYSRATYTTQWHASCACGWVDISVVEQLADAAAARHLEAAGG